MQPQKLRLAILLSIFVFLPLIIRFLIFSYNDFILLHDETVVTNISSQDISKIFNIIKSEPHPPGFYLLLHLFHKVFTNWSVVKVFFMIINSTLIALSIFLIYKFKLLNLLNYYFFAVLLSMYGVLNISSLLKQDIFSFPVFLLATTFSYLFLKSKINISIYLKTQLFLLLFLLLFGYLYYFYSLALIVFTLYLKKSLIKSIPLVIFNLLLLFLYMSIFFYEQILVNMTRFSWVENERNNILYSLTEFSTSNIYLDIARWMILFLFFSIGLYYLYKKTSRRFMLHVLILFTLVIIVFTNANLFVRSRYVLPIHLLFVYIISVGFYSLDKSLNGYLKINTLFIFIIFLAINLNYLYSINKSLYTAYNRIILSTYYFQDKVGLLTQRPILSYVLYLNLDLNSNVVPLSKELPGYKFENKIDYQILSTDGMSKKLNSREVSLWLFNTNIKNFLYFQNSKEKITGYYDLELVVLNTLDKSCKLFDAITVGKQYILYSFKDCDFEL